MKARRPYMRVVTRKNNGEELRSTLSKVRTDLGELAHEVVELGKTEAKEARERLGEQVRSRIDSIRQSIDEGVGAIEQQVKEHPFVAVATALGLGFVVGMFLKRK